MTIIGITGNSGSGKTIFSNILAEKMKAIIIDADKIAKQSSKKGEIYYNKIVELFGEEILENGEINRKKLAKIIYDNNEQRNYLNKLTNKYVVEKIKLELKEHEDENIIMDVPLLFESKLNEICDVTVSLIAKEKIKIQRMITRDSIDENFARQRLNIQKTNNYYIEKSNYVIVNNEANLEEEAEELVKTIKMLNEKIVVIKNEDVKYMQIRELLKYKEIEHCFTLRPMNFGDNLTYKQNKEIIENNYKKICENLNLDERNVVRPYQTHTNNVRKVNEEIGIYPKEFENVDGLITEKHGKVLSLTFADCTPIYIVDKEKKVVALIHSGWAGTTKKIVKNAIEKLREEYEFKYMNNIDEIIETGKKQGKYYINTVEINKNLMKEAGILEENIIDCEVCSLCNSETIHSYRKNGKKAGRNTAILCLK